MGFFKTKPREFLLVSCHVFAATTMTFSKRSRSLSKVKVSDNSLHVSTVKGDTYYSETSKQWPHNNKSKYEMIQTPIIKWPSMLKVIIKVKVILHRKKTWICQEYDMSSLKIISLYWMWISETECVWIVVFCIWKLVCYIFIQYLAGLWVWW